MQSDDRVLKELDQILAIELTAINQFFLHARIFKHWGLKQLNEREYHHSIEAMKQADQLIERILFLEGLPNLQRYNRIQIGENSADMLDCDLKLQEDAHRQLQQAIKTAETQHDFMTRALLNSHLSDNEAHIEWIQTQLSLMENMGLANYQQAML